MKKAKATITRSLFKLYPLGVCVKRIYRVQWLTLFTQHIAHDFPNIVNPVRGAIVKELYEVSMLRNRIAHHEPIFSMNLIRFYGYINGPPLGCARQRRHTCNLTKHFSPHGTHRLREIQSHDP